MKIELEYPIVIEGADGAPDRTITSVTLRRLKGRDMRRLEAIKDGESVSLATIGGLTGLTDAEVDEMDMSDIERVSAVVEDFLSGKA